MFAGFKPGRPHRVAVVAFDGVVLADLATPCEIFGRAPEGRYQVQVCSLKRRVRTAHVTLEVPHRLDVLRRADTVIVPGLEGLDRPVPPQLLMALQQAARRGARLASICSGAFVLAATGLLDGLTATTHWQAAAELARRYPRITVDPDVLYVDHGNLLTSAGAAAGLDLCLHLVREDLGAQAAANVARAAVMPLERAGGQAQFIAHAPSTPEAGSLQPLLTWLERNLHHPLSLPLMARHAAMSPRTLSRRFRAQVGTTPALWVTQARVRRAQRLLETTALSVEALAGEVGFGSAAVMREHFARSVGLSPLDYRRNFRALGTRR